MVRRDNYDREEQPTERRLNPNFRLGAGPMERDLPDNPYYSSMDNTDYGSASGFDAAMGGLQYLMSGDEMQRFLQAYGDKNVGLGGIFAGEGNVSGVAGKRGAKAAKASKGMGKMTPLNRGLFLGGLLTGASDISKELTGYAFDPMGAGIESGFGSAMGAYDEEKYGSAGDSALAGFENNFGRGRYDPETQTYFNDQFKGRRANALAGLRSDGRGPNAYDRTMGAAQAGLNALSAGGSDVVTGTIGNMFDKNYSKNAGMDMDPYGAGKLGYNAWGWVLDNWDRVMGNNTGVQTPQIPEGEDFTY